MIRSITLPDETWAELIILAQRDNVFIEGNILKLLDPGDSKSHSSYVDRAIAHDKSKRERRLEVTKQIQASTKQIQAKNEELLKAQELIEQNAKSLRLALEQAEAARSDTERALQESKEATLRAESSKKEAEQQLDYIHKRKQFELMGDIVRMAILVVVGVGATTTIMYSVAVFGGNGDPTNTTLLANTWSNMFGILLTNSFSIIGTIMGVKYATEGGNKTG